MHVNTNPFGSVSTQDLLLYEKVREILHTFYSFNSKHTILTNSHILARVVAGLVKDLTVVDGLFMGLSPNDDISVIKTYLDHSWLVTPDKTILEVFPVGSFVPNVIMLPTNGDFVIGGSGHYVENNFSAETIRKALANREAYRQLQVLSKILALQSSAVNQNGP